MKSIKGDKHKKSGKNDGHKPADNRGRGDKRLDNLYEDFDGKKIK